LFAIVAISYSSVIALFFVLALRPPPTPTLFPYTTLFRSLPELNDAQRLKLRQLSLLTLAKKDGPSGNGASPALDYDSLQKALDLDRKSTRLNSSHVKISYAVFCLKKKNTIISKKLIMTTL